MARARTVAVVVPSPATSLVLEATSWRSLAPRFSNLSLRVMARATVTPSANQCQLPPRLRDGEEQVATLGTNLW